MHRNLLFGSVMGVVLAGAVIAPEAMPATAAPIKSAAFLLHRAQRAVHDGNYAETFSFHSGPLPPAARTLSLAFPKGLTANAHIINLYNANGAHWRVEETTPQGRLVRIVAQRANLVRNVSARGTTTARAQGSRLQWGLPHHWATRFRAAVLSTHMAGVPVYQVTLVPKGTAQSGNVASIRYWIQSRYYTPMGMQIMSKHGHDLFSLKARIISEGTPGPSAKLPPIDHAIYHPNRDQVQGKTISLKTRLLPSLPSRLGSLALTDQKIAGNNAVAVYGRGFARVMVIESRGGIVSHNPIAKKTERSLSGYPGFTSLNEGLWSTVSFRNHGVTVTLIGSREPDLLAKWASVAWHVR